MSITIEILNFWANFVRLFIELAKEKLQKIKYVNIIRYVFIRGK